MTEHLILYVFSREPRLYKRVSVRRSVGWSVGWTVGPSVGPSVRNAFVSAGRDKPANDLLHVYEIVFLFEAFAFPRDGNLVRTVWSL